MNISPIKKLRFHELDIMRFLAAMAVLLYHYTFYAHRLIGTPAFGADKILRYGYLGVDAFFMISGYVVLMSSMHKTPKYFFISRLIRLYPAYWVSCLLTFGILYFGKVSLPGLPVLTFKLLAYNLTMLQGFVGKPHLNPVFWTLTYEIGFYFIIILLSAFKLWKHLLLVISGWLIYTLIMGMTGNNNVLTYFLIPKYSCCFIAGMLFYLLRVNYTAQWKIYLLLAVCFLLNLKSAYAIMVIMNDFYHDGYAFKSYAVILVVTVFYIFFLLSAWGKLDSARLKNIAKLGVLTYPLYLIHAFGIVAFIVWGSQINKYVLLLGVTTTALLIAACIYQIAERRPRAAFKALIAKVMNTRISILKRSNT